MGYILAVTSGKGGAGKSAVACNLAWALTRHQKTVLVIDCACGMRADDVFLGMSSRVVYDLNDCLEGKRSVKDAAARHDTNKSLFLLGAPLGRGVWPPPMERLDQVLLEGAQGFDFVILDLPSRLDEFTGRCMELSQMTALVTRCSASSLRCDESFADEIRRSLRVNLRLIVNFVDPYVMRRGGPNVDDAIDAVSARLLGVVVRDGTVVAGENLGLPGGARSAQLCIDNIARRLLGERVPVVRVR